MLLFFSFSRQKHRSFLETLCAPHRVLLKVREKSSVFEKGEFFFEFKKKKN